LRRLEEVMKRWSHLPLLARPAWIEDDVVVIVDETRLPDEVAYVRAKDFREAAEAIREMKTRAAGQFLTIIHAMLLTAIQNSNQPPEEQLRILREAADRLGSARPTAPLRRVAERLFEFARQAYRDGRGIAEALEERVSEYLDQVFTRRVRWAKVASTLIEDGYTILTHCNISGGMVLVGRECRREGKEVSFIATETRPYLQGARLTAWELHQDGFPVTLITDNAVGYVLWRGMVDIAIVGSDRCAMNGDIANKIGTYQIALACFEHDVPFYVGAYPDPSIPTGRDIPIEERDPNEVLYFRGVPIAPEGVNAYYPAFDITPAKYIAGIITSEGVFPPTRMREVLARVPPRL